MSLIRLTCKESSRLQSEAQERALSLGERVSLRLHMTLCDACTNVGRQLEFLRRAMRDYPGPGE